MRLPRALRKGCIVAACVITGCAGLRHGATMNDYAGQVLKVSEQRGSRRLQIEADYDKGVSAWISQHGKPDYIHVVGSRSLEVCYLDEDRLVTFSRAVFLPNSTAEATSPIPERLSSQFVRADREHLAQLRHPKPIPVVEKENRGGGETGRDHALSSPIEVPARQSATTTGSINTAPGKPTQRRKGTNLRRIGSNVANTAETHMNVVVEFTRTECTPIVSTEREPSLSFFVLSETALMSVPKARDPWIMMGIGALGYELNRMPNVEVGEIIFTDRENLRRGVRFVVPGELARTLQRDMKRNRIELEDAFEILRNATTQRQGEGIPQ